MHAHSIINTYIDNVMFTHVHECMFATVHVAIATCKIHQLDANFSLPLFMFTAMESN